jgi:phospholipase/carboxylesterase
MRQTTLGGLEVRITGGNDGNGSGEGPLVVLLHGFGAPGDDLVPLWRVLDVRGTLAVRYAFPEAPLDLGAAFGGGGGARAWWWVDLEARMRRQMHGGSAWEIDEVPEGLGRARSLVTAMLEEAVSTLQPSKLVLGGFSQGAMLSLDVALGSSVDLVGLALLSGTHIAAKEWAGHLASGARRQLPVFMSHGREDALLPFTTAERLRDVLMAAGLEVTWLPFRGGHGIPPEVVEGLGAFLSRSLGSGLVVT